MNRCKCGNKNDYNFALNIGLCNPCIEEKLASLEDKNKQLIKDLHISFILFIAFLLFGIGVGLCLPIRASTDDQWGTDDPDYIEPMFMRIKHLQVDLEAAGFDPCGIDGIYGPGTDRAWNEYETWYMERPIE